MEKKENVRELIMDMVTEITAEREKSHILIKNVLDKYNYLPVTDKNFIKKVTEGILERMLTIDYVLNQYSKVPVNKMKPMIRSLMRMSVYQILYLDKVPDSAVCNEAVKLAQKRGFGTLKGFVNGVLRNIARNKDAIVYPDRETNKVLALSVEYAMPKELVQLLLSQYTEQETEHILQGYLLQRPVCVRLSAKLSEAEKEQILKDWEAHSIEAKAHPWLPYAYELKRTGDLLEEEHFCRGHYTVQDVSSMLVGEIADYKEQDYVIDVCSAPGGKALHACDMLHGSGRVDARDVSEYKTGLILENKERMRADNLTVKVWDARVLDEGAVQKADVVLLDIPCSGLGVIGKKPEIKYRLKKESLAELDVLQRQIADVVCSYVKPGGTLIYSTCTLRKEENEQMLAYIIDKYDFMLENINPYIAKELQNEDTKKGYLTLLPSEKSDGFFLARLKAR